MFLKKYFRFALLLSLFSGLVLLSANAMSSKDASHSSTSEILLGGHGHIAQDTAHADHGNKPSEGEKTYEAQANHDSNHIKKNASYEKGVEHIVHELTSIQPEESAPIVEQMPPVKGYMLGAGDALRVIVYGEPQLTSKFKVSDTGTIAMPLIGQVDVGGLTISEAEKMIVARLRDGYIRDPKVSVEVDEYRSFYILGEVREPGVYEYKAGMNILNAVAIAGGYTYRANKGEMELLSPDQGQNSVIDVPPTSEVHPGDIILIKERFF